MRFLSFFIIFFLGITPVMAIESSSLSGQVESHFLSAVDRIVMINKNLRKKSSQVVVEKLFRERETLTRYAKGLYNHLETREQLVPGMDVSARYRLVLQRYALSCEIAALRMVIEATTGKLWSEERIIRSIPHFPGPIREGVWGDPDKEFVGSYHGSQNRLTGYGVYELPLAHYLSSIGSRSRISNIYKGTQMTRDERLADILSAVRQGKHVILWGDWCTTDIHEDGVLEKTDVYIVSLFQISAKNRCYRDPLERISYWKTHAGDTVKGLAGEHAFILLGYVGSIDVPTHIIVWDTDTGKHYYPLYEWFRKWELMDYRALIVDGETSLEQK